MTIPTKPTYSHGSTGTAPSSAIDYANGDPLNADELDYYLHVEFAKIKALIDWAESIDTNDDGKVDAADSADEATNVTSTYKGNDLDSDGDGKVDAAETADSAKTYKGNDLDSDGDGVVDSADYAATAGDADTVDGNDATALTGISLGSYNSRPESTGTYSNPENNPIYVLTSMSAGATVEVDAEIIWDQGDPTSDEERADVFFLVPENGDYTLTSNSVISHTYVELK